MNPSFPTRQLPEHPDLEQLRRKLKESHRSFLHIASARLLLQVAALLLNHGADVNVQAADQSTPLDVAGILCNPNHRAESVADMTCCAGVGLSSHLAPL